MLIFSFRRLHVLKALNLLFLLCTCFTASNLRTCFHILQFAESMSKGRKASKISTDAGSWDDGLINETIADVSVDDTIILCNWPWLCMLCR